MEGSGITAEEMLKAKLEEKKKKKKGEHERKMKKKREKMLALAEQKKENKRRELERKRKIEKDFENLKAEHGGLTGTEDTGYDDSAMSSYVSRDEPGQANLMVEDDFESNEYETLLIEHRNHVLTKTITEGNRYIDFN